MIFISLLLDIAKHVVYSDTQDFSDFFFWNQSSEIHVNTYIIVLKNYFVNYDRFLYECHISFKAVFLIKIKFFFTLVYKLKNNYSLKKE